jgi:hypothetical protein
MISPSARWWSPVSVDARRNPRPAIRRCVSPTARRLHGSARTDRRRAPPLPVHTRRTRVTPFHARCPCGPAGTARPHTHCPAVPPPRPQRLSSALRVRPTAPPSPFVHGIAPTCPGTSRSPAGDSVAAVVPCSAFVHCGAPPAWRRSARLRRPAEFRWCGDRALRIRTPRRREEAVQENEGWAVKSWGAPLRGAPMVGQAGVPRAVARESGAVRRPPTETDRSARRSISHCGGRLRGDAYRRSDTLSRVVDAVAQDRPAASRCRRTLFAFVDRL